MKLRFLAPIFAMTMVGACSEETHNVSNEVSSTLASKELPDPFLEPYTGPMNCYIATGVIVAAVEDANAQDEAYYETLRANKYFLGKVKEVYGSGSLDAIEKKSELAWKDPQILTQSVACEATYHYEIN